MSIRILLVNAHRIGREGLRCLLSHEPDLEVAGAAATGAEAISAARNLEPNIVILDSSTAAFDPIETVRRIHQAAPRSSIVALSLKSDRHQALQMMRAGAIACLPADFGFQELARAVRCIASAQPYSQPEEAENSSRDPGRESRPSRPHGLTRREVEVLQLLAAGKRVKEIAGILQISAKTVESHRQNVMDKLGIHSAIELARYALREGLVSI